MVADVGGTNIRLGLCQESSIDIQAVQKLACADFPSLEAALTHYLRQWDADKQVRYACLAVAGPVDSDRVAMTNLPWVFSQSALKKTFGWDRLAIINDFSAVAHAVWHLQPHELSQVGGWQTDPAAPILVVGPGTGLGMASVLPVDDGYKAFPAEGGHATIAAQTAQERQIIEHICSEDPSSLSPCREALISGRGLQAIYRAIGGDQSLDPATISTLAMQNGDRHCCEALDIFCGWFGSLCGDQVLSSGSLGGVYIGGGLIKKILPFFQDSSFRNRFENKGAMRDYLRPVPCNVILRDHVALLGTAAVRLDH